MNAATCMVTNANDRDQPAAKSKIERGNPISPILDANGSIKRGVSGSFDPKGFRMITGPDGAPRFVAEGEQDKFSPATDCGDRWDDRFWTNGVGGGVVNAVAADGSGNVYIGGTFSVVGNVTANGVAKWNGSNWSALGTDVGGLERITVLEIAVSGTDVYIGGFFTTVGSTAVNSIAKWDGSNWSALGSGLRNGQYEGMVHSIAVSGTDVYVGGLFTNAGGISANNIARWNGSSWSALGAGVDNRVWAVAVSGSDVYAAGGFTSAGGVPVNFVARWNGSSWSAMGSTTNNYILAIAVSGTTVYAGGLFTTIGGVAANGIAKWDGSSWSPLASGVYGGYEPIIYAITVSGTDVYVGGRFETAGGVAETRGLAKWNGSNWSALGSGVNVPAVYSIAVSGTDVYVGGSFTLAGGVATNSIAKWSGSGWSALGTAAGLGVNGSVSAIAVSGTDVYVGGYFNSAGQVVANGIAKWDGTRWSALGTGISGNYPYVYAIVVSGPDVYVGGSFTSAGGVPGTQSVAKWNGTIWSAIGSGVNGGVSAIAVSGTDVYVGGSFTWAGGNPANGVAKWNGANWSALGTGVGGYYQGDYPDVLAVAVSGSNVYIGGYFASAGGVPGTQSVAKWNGSNWSALGSGISGEDYVYTFVSALVVSGTDVYVGGGFKFAGGVAGTEGIARWNGTSWSALGSGLVIPLSCGPWECWYGGVYDLSVSGSDVYVGGHFATTDGVASYIAKWNGSGWSAFGSGTNFSVSTLAVSSSDLYVGGGFTTAGCHAAAGFSRFSLAVFEVAGRVTTSAGFAVRGARVVLDDGSGNVRFALTNPFGYFRFFDVATGDYTVSVRSKSFRFTPRTLSVSSSLTGLDFVALSP